MARERNSPLARIDCRSHFPHSLLPCRWEGGSDGLRQPLAICQAAFGCKKLYRSKTCERMVILEIKEEKEYDYDVHRPLEPYPSSSTDSPRR